MLTWLKSYLAKARGKSGDRDPSALLGLSGGGGGPALAWPFSQTTPRVEQVRHFTKWNYIAIDTIAREFAQAPPNLSWVRTPTRPGDSSKYACRQRALTPLMAHEQLELVPDNHPLRRLLADPNDPDTSYDLWYETILFYLLCGVAYWWVPRQGKLNLPSAIWVIPSHWMHPVPGPDRLVGSYEMRPTEGNYLSRVIPADEIVVFKKKNPLSKIDGYAPQTAGSQWVDTNEAVARAQFWAYKNGTFPTVAVSFDGSLHDPSEGDLRRIEEKFTSRLVGETRSNRPVFLPPGVTLTPLSVRPNQMVFGETEQATAQNILALYHVPAICAGLMDNLTSNALRAAKSGLYDQAVNPERRYFGQVLTEKVAVPFYGPNLRAWWEDATPPDPEVLENQLKTDLLYGARTANEIRAIRGLQPYDLAKVPWADEPVRPVNVETGSAPFGGDHNDTPTPDADYDHPAINDSDTKAVRRPARDSQQPWTLSAEHLHLSLPEGHVQLDLPTPEVHVTVPAPIVHVQTPAPVKTTREILRDAAGYITAVEDTTVYAAPTSPPE